MPRSHDSALISTLREVGLGAVPCVTPDVIRQAVADFSPTSHAGASGLRPAHLRQAVRLAAGDQLLSFLSEVVQMFHQGMSRSPSDFGYVGHLSWPSANPQAISDRSPPLEVTRSRIQNVLEPVQVGVKTSR